MVIVPKEKMQKGEIWTIKKALLDRRWEKVDVRVQFEKKRRSEKRSKHPYLSGKQSIWHREETNIYPCAAHYN